jgi:transposase
MKIELRSYLKFLVKLKKDPAEYFQMLKEVYVANVMSSTLLLERHELFMEGREEVEDDKRPGRTSTSQIEEKVEKISEIVRKNLLWSIRMIAEMVNMDKETVRQVLHDQLNMRKACAKMVPKKLTQE